LRVLLDEMYPAALAVRSRAAAIEAATAADLTLAGRSDSDVFSTAVAQGWTLLTENVADFTRIAADHVTAGHHHPGVLIALSSRFSRRPAGIGPLVVAIRAVAGDQLEDRVVYLQPMEPSPEDP